MQAKSHLLSKRTKNPQKLTHQIHQNHIIPTSHQLPELELTGPKGIIAGPRVVIHIPALNLEELMHLEDKVYHKRPGEVWVEIIADQLRGVDLGVGLVLLGPVRDEQLRIRLREGVLVEQLSAGEVQFYLFSVIVEYVYVTA